MSSVNDNEKKALIDVLFNDPELLDALRSKLGISPDHQRNLQPHAIDLSQNCAASGMEYNHQVQRIAYDDTSHIGRFFGTAEGNHPPNITTNHLPHVSPVAYRNTLQMGENHTAHLYHIDQSPPFAARGMECNRQVKRIGTNDNTQHSYHDTPSTGNFFGTAEGNHPPNMTNNHLPHVSHVAYRNALHMGENHLAHLYPIDQSPNFAIRGMEYNRQVQRIGTTDNTQQHDTPATGRFFCTAEGNHPPNMFTNHLPNVSTVAFRNTLQMRENHKGHQCDPPGLVPDLENNRLWRDVDDGHDDQRAAARITTCKPPDMYNHGYSWYQGNQVKDHNPCDSIGFGKPAFDTEKVILHESSIYTATTWNSESDDLISQLKSYIMEDGIQTQDSLENVSYIDPKPSAPNIDGFPEYYAREDLPKYAIVVGSKNIIHYSLGASDIYRPLRVYSCRVLYDKLLSHFKQHVTDGKYGEVVPECIDQLLFVSVHELYDDATEKYTVQYIPISNRCDRDKKVKADISGCKQKPGTGPPPIHAKIENLLVLINTKRIELSITDANLYPTEIMVFTNILKSVEGAIETGITDVATVNRHVQVIEKSWKGYFTTPPNPKPNTTSTKRKKIDHIDRANDGASNCYDFDIQNDPGNVLLGQQDCWARDNGSGRSPDGGGYTGKNGGFAANLTANAEQDSASSHKKFGNHQVDKEDSFFNSEYDDGNDTMPTEKIGYLQSFCCLSEVEKGLSKIDHSFSKGEVRNSFNITVRSLLGNIFTLNVKPCDTVATVKSMLSVMVNIHPIYQRLMFDGQKLDNDHTLSYYNIDKLSTLYLVKLLRGSGSKINCGVSGSAGATGCDTIALCRAAERFDITVTTLLRKKITLSVTFSDTIATVKIMLYEKIGISPTRQRLFFRRGATLEDDHDLRYYNIDKESKLYLAPFFRFRFHGRGRRNDWGITAKCMLVSDFSYKDQVGPCYGNIECAYRRNDSESEKAVCTSNVVVLENNNGCCFGGLFKNFEDMNDPFNNGSRLKLPATPYTFPNEFKFTPSSNGRNGWNCETTYDISDELCRGAFGAVYKASHRLIWSDSDRVLWKNVAIKQFRPNLLDLRDGRVIETYDDVERYCEEVKVLLHLQQGSEHTSNVLHLYEYYLNGRDVFIVTELLDKDLDVWRQECEVFTELNAIDICRSILQAIKFVSDRKVVHRDIKLQNILFRKSNDFRSLKLVDFGISRILEDNESVRDFCGSVGYIPPEIYSGKSYRFEVDMFSFGVLLFRLLSAERPFPNSNSQILRRHTLEYRYCVNGTAWDHVTDTAKDLVKKLLVNRGERLTVEQALVHPWFSTSIIPSEPELPWKITHQNLSELLLPECKSSTNKERLELLKNGNLDTGCETLQESIRQSGALSKPCVKLQAYKQESPGFQKGTWTLLRKWSIVRVRGDNDGQTVPGNLQELFQKQSTIQRDVSVVEQVTNNDDDAATSTASSFDDSTVETPPKSDARRAAFSFCALRTNSRQPPSTSRQYGHTIIH